MGFTISRMDLKLMERRQKALADQIRFVRAERRMTQKAIWEATEIGRSSYRRIEDAEKDPSTTELYLIADALKVPYRDLLDGADARVEGKPVTPPAPIEGAPESMGEVNDGFGL